MDERHRAGTAPSCHAAEKREILLHRVLQQEHIVSAQATECTDDACQVEKEGEYLIIIIRSGKSQVCCTHEAQCLFVIGFCLVARTLHSAIVAGDEA